MIRNLADESVHVYSSETKVSDCTSMCGLCSVHFHLHINGCVYSDCSHEKICILFFFFQKDVHLVYK
jgi:hypothetical protein